MNFATIGRRGRQIRAAKQAGSCIIQVRKQSLIIILKSAPCPVKALCFSHTTLLRKPVARFRRHIRHRGQGIPKRFLTETNGGIPEKIADLMANHFIGDRSHHKLIKRHMLIVSQPTNFPMYGIWKSNLYCFHRISPFRTCIRKSIGDKGLSPYPLSSGERKSFTL